MPGLHKHPFERRRLWCVPPLTYRVYTSFKIVSLNKTDVISNESEVDLSGGAKEKSYTFYIPMGFLACKAYKISLSPPLSCPPCSIEMTFSLIKKMCTHSSPLNKQMISKIASYLNQQIRPVLQAGFVVMIRTRLFK